MKLANSNQPGSLLLVRYSLYHNQQIIMARKLNLNGTMKVLDEEVFGPNETATKPFAETITLDDEQLEDVVEISKGVGGEVRGELLIRGQLLSNDRIRVWVDTWLYEGTSEATQDLDGERHFNFILLPNQTVNKTYTVYNTAENADDYVKVGFTCKNLSA